MKATSKKEVKVVTVGDILDNPNITLDELVARFVVEYVASTDLTSYHLSSRSLTSLQRRGEWATKIDVFNVVNNALTSMEHGPTVTQCYTCRNNQITSLMHGPTSVHYFDCSENRITSLRGAPRVIHDSFNCNYNKLTSLKGIHEQIDYMSRFSAEHNYITSHVLGLMLIDGLQRVALDNMQVEEILNRHLGKGRVGMLMAQEDLIEAGLEEFAQL